MTAAEIRPDLAARLRPPGDTPVRCKVCGNPAPVLGVTDFNRSCEEARGVRLAPSGVEIAYRRCSVCGLVFTDAFDDWTHDDFRTHVYNAAYPEVDPDSREKRPAGNAAWFAKAFAHARDRLDILDYGGGDGRFCADMRRAGYACESWDALFDEGAPPDRRFNLVTSFETLEHLPDPTSGAAAIAGLTAPDGVVFMSTLVQPEPFEPVGMGWWYIGPRNGHVTLFSRPALAILWSRLGFKVASFNDNLHMAFRGAEPPAFVREAFAR